MSETGFLFLLYAAALIAFVAEVFVPSHGLLTVLGLGLLIAAIVKTFEYHGTTAGGSAIVLSVIGLPVFAVVAVRAWPNTRIGRIIAPQNPVYRRHDHHPESAEIESFVGCYGKTLTPLRPVGTCEFDDRRIQCVCESGMIDAGVKVRAIELRGRELVVSVADDHAVA